MKRSRPGSPAPGDSSRPASSRDGARSARSRVSMPTTSATTRRARRRIRQEPSAGRDTSAMRSAGLTSTLTGRRLARRGRSVRRTPASQPPSGSKGHTTSAAEETSSCSSATRGTVRAVTRQSTSARIRRLSCCGSLSANSWAISDATPGSATSTIRTTCAAAAGRKSVTVSIRSGGGHARRFFARGPVVTPLYVAVERDRRLGAPRPPIRPGRGDRPTDGRGEEDEETHSVTYSEPMLTDQKDNPPAVDARYDPPMRRSVPPTARVNPCARGVWARVGQLEPLGWRTILVQPSSRASKCW